MPCAPLKSALQRVKIAHFWEDFLTAKSTKNTKIRGRDRSISLFVFFAIFAVKSIWLRRSCAALICGNLRFKLPPFAVFTSAALLLLAGCSTTGPGARAGEPYIVNSHGTLFYSFGPVQAAGPDFSLPAGQRVTMLSYSYGYSHVVTQSGRAGYVPTDDLQPAPPAPSPKPGSTPSATPHRRSTSIFRQPASADQSPVPLPEFPESKPPPNAPGFRY